MKRRNFISTAVFAIAIFLLTLTSCSLGDNDEGGGKDPDENISAFDKFKNKSEFDSYLNALFVSDGTDATPASPTDTEELATTDGQVETNNQSDNVDEGDIIKFAGDRLIVLRDQHVIVMDIAGDSAANPVILDKYELDVDFGNEWYFQKGAWYDEMLIFDSSIVLIAYRYNAKIRKDDDFERTGAIEVVKLGLNDDGTISGQRRLFIESSDYYTGATNYTSRKIGENLILYSPFYAHVYGAEEGKIPHILKLVDPSEKIFERVSPAIGYTDIYRGEMSCAGAVLHAVYTLNVGSMFDTLKATGVMGSFSKVYYVTDQNFYLNVGVSDWNVLSNTSLRSTLYRIALNGEPILEDLMALEGEIPERFAMSDDGKRLKFLTANDYINGYESDEAQHSFSAISVDNSNFSDVWSETILTDSYAGFLSVRFNSDLAVLSTWMSEKLFLVNFEAGVSITETGVDANGIKMMQPYGDDGWLALGFQRTWVDSNSYKLSTSVRSLGISSDGDLVEHSNHELEVENAWSEALWNDHAFFFDPSKDLFGVPYISWDDSVNNYESGVEYFSLKANQIIPVSGDDIVQEGDFCYECWYGNSRVVRKNENLYNLLGRNIVVTQYDGPNNAMHKVSRLELFEAVN